MGIAEIRSGAACPGRGPRAGRPGARCVLEAEHRRQRLELDLDKLRAVLGQRLALGDDDRDRLAGVDDLLRRERLIRTSWPAAGERQVGGCQHGNHTCKRLGRVGPDHGDQRVRLVGQDEPRV